MVGESFKLKAVNASGRRVYFSSSNKKIATVSSKGVVRGKKRGTVTIKVRVGAKKYECKVTVQTTQDSYMTQVRKLINLERRNYGRPALDYNKYLDAAAKKRAKELYPWIKLMHQRVSRIILA